MAIIAAERTIEQLFERGEPGGLWAALARAADAPAVAAGDVWRGLERRMLTGEAPAGTGMWVALAEQVDPTQYRPCAVPDVAEEQVLEGDQTLTVMRSPRGTYLRLTAPQREVWHQMDGTRTVTQLATKALIQFKQLLPIGDLVTALRTEGFLTDPPVGVYRAVGASLESRTAEGWGRRVLRVLSSKSWQFQDIDGFYSAIYRAFGWLLFTPVFLALWGLVALVGLAAFVLLLFCPGGLAAECRAGDPASAASGLPLAIVGLWVALLISFFLHESAHALTVKHYGRTLRSGGMMLYFGAPAFFVDTSDIWRSPRRARMLVSAAGPMSDLFIGALAALLALTAGDVTVASVASKLAFTCYIATLFNANPLLELDGYFILVDWLRLPDLRRRALAFVRGQLWAKLRRGAALDREERIFTLYGALTVLYSFVAIAFAFQFWKRYLWGTILDLWASQAPLAWLAAAALFLLIVVPVALGLLFAGLGFGRAGLAWVIRRGYGRQPALLAAIAVTLALAVTWLSWRVAGTPYRWVGLWIAPVLWGVALGALVELRPDYRRAAIAPALNALLVMTALSGLAAFVRVVAPGSPGWWAAWVAADGLAFAFLLLAGFAALLDVDLRLAMPRELVLTAVLLMLAFAVGGIALLNAFASDSPALRIAVVIAPRLLPALRIAIAAPAYFGALTLALLLPQLFDLRDSRLIWSWALMWCAGLVQTAAYVLNLASSTWALDVLVASLWLATWGVHLATLRQIALDEIAWPHEPSMSEEQRLRRAFQFCYAGCYRLLRAVYGARRTRALDDRMDVLAATANWDVTLDRDRVRISSAVLALSLDTQGARYAEVLRYTVATIEEIAGATFARRAIQAAYDALPWPERETASRLCFPDTPWARELSSQFGDVRTGRLRLLRQVDQFLNCDDDDLADLAHTLHEQNVAASTTLLREGEPSPGVWVIEAGEVVALRGGQVVDELHRGDSFGVSELIGGVPAALRYRTAIASSLLFVPAADFQRLAQASASAGEGQDAASVLRLLERVPLFADLPRNTLRGLVHIAESQEFPPRSVIVRQGTPSGKFYVIKQGRVAVLARNEPKGGAAPVRQIAQLGEEEFFGELELLRGTPPVASVVALTPLMVLSLPHAALQAFILGDSGVAKGLEQVGTGRLIALRAGAAGTP